MSTARFEPIAEQYLDVKLRGPVEFMCQCPFCSGSSSLQYNIENGLWVCFRCDAKGNAKSLVRRLGGSYSDPAVSVEVLTKALDKLRLKGKHDEEERVYDESYLLRFEGDSPDEYWKTRGFREETMREWGLGYDPITDRCTIAYRNPSGDLLGVIQRRLDDTFPRYLYPKGFNRSESVFGSWQLARRTVLVEGSTDTCKIGQAGFTAGGQYGSSISTKQVRLLRRQGVKELVLFYDYDEAGRKAEDQARTVLDGFILRRVSWDEGMFCWHKKLCGCGDHTWRTIGQCQRKVLCRCGRKHEMDPGKLSDLMIGDMIENAHLIGKKEPLWRTRKSAS